MKSTIFIGVDVSQRTLDIARATENRGILIANRADEIRAWLAQLPPGCCIGVESTGHYHRLLVRCAIKAGQTVYLLNARDLSHYARSGGVQKPTGSMPS